MNLMNLGHIKLGHIRLGHVRQGHVKGFTLIELLVVIAIIGILSSVVLASLNTARNRGADAAVKSNLANARAEAEIYYDTTNSYGTANSTGTSNVCAATGANVIGDSVAAAATAGGGTSSCVVTATGWAASARLKGDTTAWYCVDSTGYAANVTAVNSDGTCL